MSSEQKIIVPNVAKAQRLEQAQTRLNRTIRAYHGAEVTKGEEPTAVNEERQLTGIVGSSQILEPYYNQRQLRAWLEDSAELVQVLAALIANTVGYGYRLVLREHIADELRNAPTPELIAERVKLENFFSYANPRQNLLQVLEEAEWDFYSTGNMYFEITRNGRGKPDGIRRIPSFEMGITPPLDSQRVRVKQIHRTSDGKGYEIKRRLEHIRFRKYAHRLPNSGGGISVWFKEFQDPNVYDRESGEIAADKSKAKELKDKGLLAHEVMHVAAPLKRGPYGLPQHIGNLASVQGDIFSENINLATFRNNNIPSMVISVSGGQLTAPSCDRLAEFVESKIQGNNNRSRFLLLESETLDPDDLDSGRSKINVEPLTHVQQNDAMFTAFSNECRAAQRRAFRMPEILVGRGDAASGVVVAASMKLADEQVFSQDRARFVDWINRRLMSELGIVSWEIELNSPNATDPQTLVNLLSTAEKTGALTPKIARMITEWILGRDLPEFADGFDQDTPFSMLMAEAVKKINDAGENNPDGSSEKSEEMNGADQTEPTQQFTSNRAGDGEG